MLCKQRILSGKWNFSKISVQNSIAIGRYKSQRNKVTKTEVRLDDGGREDNSVLDAADSDIVETKVSTH